VDLCFLVKFSTLYWSNNILEVWLCRGRLYNAHNYGSSCWCLYYLSDGQRNLCYFDVIAFEVLKIVMNDMQKDLKW